MWKTVLRILRKILLGKSEACEIVSLSKVITPEEKLARIICDSSKKNKYTKTAFSFNEEEDRYIVKTGKFIDIRNPSELSINRISTIPLEQAHLLGVTHQQEKQPDSTYHGFAEVDAELCFQNNCDVKKDDIGGKKPYHANIIYPYAQGKEDNQEIAVQLAYHARFRRFSSEEN